MRNLRSVLVVLVAISGACSRGNVAKEEHARVQKELKEAKETSERCNRRTERLREKISRADKSLMLMKLDLKRLQTLNHSLTYDNEGLVLAVKARARILDLKKFWKKELEKKPPKLDVTENPERARNIALIDGVFSSLVREGLVVDTKTMKVDLQKLKLAMTGMYQLLKELCLGDDYFYSVDPTANLARDIMEQLYYFKPGLPDG